MHTRVAEKPSSTNWAKLGMTTEWQIHAWHSVEEEVVFGMCVIRTRRSQKQPQVLHHCAKVLLLQCRHTEQKDVWTQMHPDNRHRPFCAAGASTLTLQQSARMFKGSLGHHYHLRKSRS